MSKLERLNARVTKLLAEAVHEVLEMVKETVSEYQEKTARTLRENESLKRRLQELQDKITREDTPVLPASCLLPEEEEEEEDEEDDEEEGTDNHEMPVITLAEQIPIVGHKPDHDVRRGSKQERNNNTESQADCELAQTLTEHCKAQLEELAHVPEKELTVQTSHNTNLNVSAISSNNNNPFESETSVGVNLTVVKRELEPTDCASADSPSLQEHYSGCVDLSWNSSYNNNAEPDRGQVAAEPYGLVLDHSNLTIQKRHVFAKNRRASFDLKKIRREHFRGEDSHMCVVCGKTFSRVGNLRIHQRCHTGEKPYSCIQCGRCFSQAGDLKKHKRVHTGEKPYYCNQCGKSFSRGENLKRHQKIHIGETLQLQRVWMEHQ